MGYNYQEGVAWTVLGRIRIIKLSNTMLKSKARCTDFHRDQKNTIFIQNAHACCCMREKLPLSAHFRLETIDTAPYGGPQKWVHFTLTKGQRV